MDISEVAKKSGVAASALRYYERKGLIHALQRDGARRQFSPAVLDQLALIALGQAAGFSLDEIRVMFTPGGEPNIDRGQLAAKADELERMVKRLKAMIEGLRISPVIVTLGTMIAVRGLTSAVSVEARARNPRASMGRPSARPPSSPGFPAPAGASSP